MSPPTTAPPRGITDLDFEVLTAFVTGPTNGGTVEFTDAWRDYRTYLLVDGDCAHSTIVEYGSVLRRWHRHLERHHVPWDQARRAHLDRFLARPATTGPRKGRPISTNRRRTDIVAIHGFYRYAALAGLIDRDPFALVRLPRRRQPSPRSFTLAQLAAILGGARDDDRLYLLCLLGYAAGLRRAEMAALDLADLARDPWPGALHVVGKGGYERWVPCSAKLRQAIDRHLGDRANLTAGPLVANARHPGQPLRPGTVGDMLAAHIRDVGIDPGSAHWLRHSAATVALEAAEGENLNDVREFLGHADPRTTMAYVTRFRWNVRRNVVDVMPDPEKPLAVIAAALLLGGSAMTQTMDLSGMTRSTLEEYAKNLDAAAAIAEAQRARLQSEADHLRNELAVLRRALADLTEHVFDAAQAAAHAAQLGRMLTNDQGEPE